MYIYIFISKVTYNAFRVYILYTVYAFHEIRTHKLGVASIMLHCLSYRNKIFLTSAVSQRDRDWLFSYDAARDKLPAFLSQIRQEKQLKSIKSL